MSPLIDSAAAAARIARVEAFVIVGEKDYPAGAGLATPTRSDVVAERVASGASPLRSVGALHVCSYPPQAQSCLVRITTDDGMFGWGEAHAPFGPRATKAVIEDVLAPLLIGEDPWAIERHWERMYGSMRLRGHTTGYQLEAIAGVDIALWDLLGKLAGLPIYRLLGGPFQTTLPTYASGVPGRTVAERVDAAQALLAEGYRAIKISIGRGHIDQDLASVEAVAAAIAGQADLLVDAHGAYALDQAMLVGRRLESLGVAWFEDPLPPEAVEDYTQLAAALDLPIAAGETDCTRWQIGERLRRRSLDVILPDICRAGGISEGRRIATVAGLHNARWAAHVSMGTSIHVAAAAHLAAASPNFLIFEFSSTPNPIGDDLLTAPLRPAQGVLAVPSGPGLGINFDEERLARHIVSDDTTEVPSR